MNGFLLMRLLPLHIFVLFLCAAASYSNTGTSFLPLKKYAIVTLSVTIYPDKCKIENLQLIEKYLGVFPLKLF